MYLFTTDKTYRLDVSHARIDTKRCGPVDSSDSDPVTRLYTIDKVTVHVQDDVVRGLTCKRMKTSKLKESKKVK